MYTIINNYIYIKYLNMVYHAELLCEGHREQKMC